MSGTSDDVRDRKIEDEGLLAGYPGAALLVDAGGAVILANETGAAIKAPLGAGTLPEFNELIQSAAETNGIVAGNIALRGAKGDMVLKVTVIPRATGTDYLVLCSDQSMERNLRSALVESRQRYKDLVEVSSDFAWEVDQTGKFVFVSPRGALGYTADDLVDKRPETFVVDPGDYSPLPFESDKPLEDIELWMRRADDSIACVLVSSVPLFDKEGVCHGSRGICRDVTDERQGEAALTRARHREQLLGYIVGTIRDELEPLNMLTAASAATARALSAAGSRIYRRAEDEKFIIAAEYGDIRGLEDLGGLLDGIDEADEVAFEHKIGDWRVLASATHYRQKVNGAVMIWNDAAIGEWEDENKILISDVANQLGIANEQITNHEHILSLSRTDGMTGLLNRRTFIEVEIPRRLGRLRRSGGAAALLYVDLDNFKQVNDVHGHQAGDAALLALRDLLLKYSRPGDAVARLGGDEFALWLDEIAPEVAENRAKQLLEASKALQKFSGSKESPLGLSVGIAIYDPRTNEPIDDLIARADAAMYAVKHAGKGGYIIAPTPAENAENTGEEAPGEGDAP